MLETHPELPTHLQIAHATLEVLADDGMLDLPEVDYLMAIAMRDGRISPEEETVLRRVFDGVPAGALFPEAGARIGEIRDTFGL